MTIYHRRLLQARGNGQSPVVGGCIAHFSEDACGLLARLDLGLRWLLIVPPKLVNTGDARLGSCPAFCQQLFFIDGIIGPDMEFGIAIEQE